MKYTNFLDGILGQKSKIKALRYLAKHPAGISVRELSRRVGFTEPNLSKILKELEKSGVLTYGRHGTSLVFRLNSGHFLAETVVKPLFLRERAAIEDLGRFITGRIKTRILSMIIFGSVARGEEREQSDLDIAFIVRSRLEIKKLEKEIMDLNPEAVKRFGNMIAPYVAVKADFAARLKARDPLARSIAGEGIVLSGGLTHDIL